MNSTPSKLRPPTKVIANPFSKAQKNETALSQDSVPKKRKLEASPPKTKPIVRQATTKPKTAITKSTISTAKTVQLGVKENVDGNLIKKKRPAWDTKGRLEDMEAAADLLKKKVAGSEEVFSTLQSQLTFSEQRVIDLENFRKRLENQVHDKESENNVISKDLAALRNELSSKDQLHQEEITRLKKKYEIEIEDLTSNRESLKRQKENLENELQLKCKENMELKSSLSTQSTAMITAESEKAAMKSVIQNLETMVKSKSEKIDELLAQLKNSEESCSELESKLREAETIRRKLHNEVLELKGNIRVFCRVRPLLEGENSGSMDHLKFTNNSDKEIELIQKTESVSDVGKSVAKSFPFSFDKVFIPSSTQSEVFSEISQLVQSALDGYKVCIFAYGQTGSGKTFTMEGYNRQMNPENMGMIPRAVEQIYKTAKSLEEKGWSYKMEASYLEIYNETIRDLLGNPSVDKKHEIKHNPQNGTTTVTGLTSVNVDSPKEVFNLLEHASKNRAVAETKCNDRSSRSHSVFSLKLSGENSITFEKLEGVLNLIDLAGSERLSESGSTGDRLKETQAINKSLSSLGDVIYSLANKEAHIPYRNSKLTYLLQNSLGGNCKTLMFVNISPSFSSFQETLCSLRFATKVNSCQIGTARKTIKE